MLHHVGCGKPREQVHLVRPLNIAVSVSTAERLAGAAGVVSRRPV